MKAETIEEQRLLIKACHGRAGRKDNLESEGGVGYY